MTIEVSTAGTREDVTVVRVEGHLVDGEPAAELDRALKGLVKQGKLRTVVDLEHVDWFDSIGLGLLVSHYVSVSKRNGGIVILGANNKIRTLFDLSHLSDRFGWASSLEEAVGQLGAA